jgi:hypothetical protein
MHIHLHCLDPHCGQGPTWAITCSDLTMHPLPLDILRPATTLPWSLKSCHSILDLWRNTHLISCMIPWCTVLWQAEIAKISDCDIVASASSEMDTSSSVCRRLQLPQSREPLRTHVYSRMNFAKWRVVGHFDIRCSHDEISALRGTPDTIIDIISFWPIWTTVQFH